MTPAPLRRALRRAAALLDAALAAHALWLMSRGLMHLGVLLPLVSGAAALRPLHFIAMHIDRSGRS